MGFVPPQAILVGNAFRVLPMIGFVALALVSGLLIGCVGIGGVLLVPVLTLAGVDVHAAIAASMFSFIFSGLIGVWLYQRKGSIAWGSAAWLCAGATPGALAGALLASRLSGTILLVFVGATVVFSGARSLLGGPPPTDGRALPPSGLLLIGVVVGVLSSLTGTGGPVLLVPVLLWLKIPVLTAVGLSQAIQVPIATLASVGNFWSGHLDLELGLVLGLGVAIGSGVGARIAHAVPTLLLGRLVAIVLVLVGLIVLGRSGYALMGPS